MCILNVPCSDEVKTATRINDKTHRSERNAIALAHDSRASGVHAIGIDVCTVFPVSPGKSNTIFEFGSGVLSDLIVRSASLSHPVPIGLGEEELVALAFGEL